MERKTVETCSLVRYVHISGCFGEKRTFGFYVPKIKNTIQTITNKKCKKKPLWWYGGASVPTAWVIYIYEKVPLMQRLMAEMGISGTALSWIASYLADRSYQVAWRWSVSTPRPLLTGVPRGSVLGPLLFPLYTKSLGSVITLHGFFYHCCADDTPLFLSFPSLCHTG